jgi:hypothetical protein
MFNVGDKNWTVDIMESEAGWGSRIDETHYFATEKEAKVFADGYNLKYNP